MGKANKNTKLDLTLSLRPPLAMLEIYSHT